MMEINQGTSTDEIAILYRSNAQSRVLEEALYVRELPIVFMVVYDSLIVRK